MIIYRGPSKLDRQPIVGIITLNSVNAKTGPVAQLWILREDVHPSEAIKTGEDSSVCGKCPLRGENGQHRACYVVLARGPRSVWEAYHRGKYQQLIPRKAAKLLGSTPLRLGAYGDPAALPVGILRQLVAGRKHTGYTHQWRKAASLKSLVMASVDSETEALEASAKGWRYFRVANNENLLPGEIRCPASAEMGKRTTCAKCALCDGQREDGRKSITILAHGLGANNFTTLANAT